MTRFADELFDDLMREHGSTLAGTRVPAAPKRHLASRPVLLAAGAGGVAAAAAAGTLVAGGGTPAYAVTAHPNGTVSLAVYGKAGISQANAKLQQLAGGRVVVVPVEPGCPGITSLRAPAVPVRDVRLSVDAKTGAISTLDTSGIPAGDIMVVGFQQSATGMSATSAWLTSAPVPRCVSIPPAPVPVPAGGSSQPVPPGSSAQPAPAGSSGQSAPAGSSGQSAAPARPPARPVPGGASAQPAAPGSSAQPVPFVPSGTGQAGSSARPVPRTTGPASGIATSPAPGAVPASR
jgi:hypothetical protein